MFPQPTSVGLHSAKPTRPVRLYYKRSTTSWVDQNGTGVTITQKVEAPVEPETPVEPEMPAAVEGPPGEPYTPEATVEALQHLEKNAAPAEEVIRGGSRVGKSFPTSMFGEMPEPDGFGDCEE